MPNKNDLFQSKERVRQVPTNVVLPVLFREKLRYLSRITKVPQAEYLREAVRDLIVKYSHVLNSGDGSERPF